MMIHTNAKHAINYANDGRNPKGVGYIQGKGWVAYDLMKGCPEGAVPEFVCLQGHMPIPLTEMAQVVWLSILREALHDAT